MFVVCSLKRYSRLVRSRKVRNLRFQHKQFLTFSDLRSEYGLPLSPFNLV